MSISSAKKSLEILLIDDHELFAEGLAKVLSSRDSELLMGISTNGTAALENITKSADPAGQKVIYDVILVDLDLPDMSGVDFIKSLRARHIKTPTVVISGATDLREIQRAFDVGASGFVPKSSGSEVVIAAIRSVLSGDTYLPDEYWSRISVNSNLRKESDDVDKSGFLVSPRQQEVLALLERGYSNARIANILNISVATVKTHLIALFRALDVSNRTECVRTARAQKLLD